jgi:hypothetical protein
MKEAIRMRNGIKIVLDALLAVAFVTLMDPRSVGGIAVHEWAGLVICVFFILHKALNWRWITSVTAGLFTCVGWRTRLGYILDVLLLIGMTGIVLSGIKIARTIDFTWFPIGGSTGLWRMLHASASMLSLAVVGVHVGLHWDWIRACISGKSRKECPEETNA